MKVVLAPIVRLENGYLWVGVPIVAPEKAAATEWYREAVEHERKDLEALETVSRYLRLKRQHDEAAAQAKFAESKKAVLQAERKVIELAAAPGLAEALKEIDKGIADATSTAAKAQGDARTLWPLMRDAWAPAAKQLRRAASGTAHSQQRVLTERIEAATAAIVGKIDPKLVTQVVSDLAASFTVDVTIVQNRVVNDIIGQSP